MEIPKETVDEQTIIKKLLVEQIREWIEKEQTIQTLQNNDEESLDISVSSRNNQKACI